MKDFQGLENPQTPLVEIEAMPGILNRLDPSLQPQLPMAKGVPKCTRFVRAIGCMAYKLLRRSNTRIMWKVYHSCKVRNLFFPLLCLLLNIQNSTLKTMLAFPSILLRINELLLVRQMNNNVFSAALSDQLLRAALTPPAASVDVDYERLEILGTSRFDLLIYVDLNIYR